MKEVETGSISTKYESFRLMNNYREEYLLQSIRETGIREPLQCVEGKNGAYILLDGYKRLRCCLKLNISIVPVVSAGSDEAESILYLIRLSNEKTLSILEQARFVDELHRTFGLAVSEIARRLECSPAWVSVRLGILDEMSPYVRQQVFSGRFPLRSYMYTLRPFTRVNKVSSKSIDSFVGAVSGQGLSTRNIERLAYGYFRGGEQLKKQITEGDINWALKQLNYQNSYGDAPELTAVESRLLRDLELFGKYMSRIRYGLKQDSLNSALFRKTAMLLIEGILSRIPIFVREVKSYYAKRQYT